MIRRTPEKKKTQMGTVRSCFIVSSAEVLPLSEKCLDVPRPCKLKLESSIFKGKILLHWKFRYMTSQFLLNYNVRGAGMWDLVTVTMQDLLTVKGIDHDLLTLAKVVNSYSIAAFCICISFSGRDPQSWWAGVATSSYGELPVGGRGS